MSMINEGDVQYEDAGAPVLDTIKTVIAKHGNEVQRVGRWALVMEQIFVTVKTPKPPKPKKVPKSPPPRAGAVDAGSEAGAGSPPEAEPEQAEELRKPPHLVVLRWIKPPAAVQVHMKKAKLGTGLAHILEVRADLWQMMSAHDREAAVMTKLLEREVVDGEDGEVKVKRADLPIQTHPAVKRFYGRWWEHMDPATRPETAS